MTARPITATRSQLYGARFRRDTPDASAFDAYLGSLVHDVSLAHHLLGSLGVRPPLPLTDAAFFDEEFTELLSAARIDRRMHGLRIGVHGEESRAEFGDALDAARHRVADVVQLEIEEHLLVVANERLREAQAPGEGDESG